MSLSPGAEPTIATCGECKKPHQTTTYLATRYPNDFCKDCKHKEQVTEYKEKAETAIRTLNYILEKGRNNLRASLKFKKRLEVVK